MVLGQVVLQAVGYGIHRVHGSRNIPINKYLLPVQYCAMYVLVSVISPSGDSDFFSPRFSRLLLRQVLNFYLSNVLRMLIF